MRFLKPVGNFILSITLLVVVWEFIVLVSDISTYVIPPPRHVAKALVELFTTGEMVIHVFVSLRRFALAYTISCSLGIFLGVIFGWFKFAWKLAEPIMLLLKPISPVAWTPFAIVAFGIGEAPAVFTIGIPGFFSMLFATVGAIHNIDTSYLYVARNFGLSRFQTLRKIVIPASFPYIITGLHSALTTSWIFLVAGELMGVTTGLGFFINDARHSLRADWIMAGIVVIGSLGFALDKLLHYLEGLIAKKWGLNAD